MNRYLIQQGYSSCSQEELSSLNYHVRLMPAFCLVMVIFGLIFKEPFIHFFLSALGIVGFGSKKYHPIDAVYNRIIAISNRKKLPAINPLPRRYASLMGATFNLTTGLFLLDGQYTAALYTAAILIALQLTVIFTHFCVASWLYEKFYAFLGHGDNISLSEARELRMKGALLLDVRTPKEHERQVITGALNIPLPKLRDHDIYHGKEVIIFCNSGMRSKEATKLINNSALAKAYSLGSIENAIKL
ncbi:rhodanese-like domain-containing protein [Fulvivirga ulvae]|uniref:DUF4395 family protein n=1 Tax=Fulvivirga ulvae TaxID=2904245 RepID=UPI001F2B8E11|nr:DUF4395 family protein [Fulvivirga ulvae]UII34060.1 rhodanese-like domain-containing protein [Fulvivirga ulvae]